jgi:hypothetical protein
MVANGTPIRRSARFKPVQTFYNGRKFDRRLEARWAVALDTLGVGFRYYNANSNPGEGSMFELPGFGDFWLLIRPALPVKADIQRAKRWVSEGNAQEVVILFGNCGMPSNKKTYGGFAWWRNSAGCIKEDVDVLWRECLLCSSPSLAASDEACPNCERRGMLSDSTIRLALAYRLAASIRFVTPIRPAV